MLNFQLVGISIILIIFKNLLKLKRVKDHLE